MDKSFNFVNVVEKPHDVMEYPFPEGSLACDREILFSFKKALMKGKYSFFQDVVILDDLKAFFRTEKDLSNSSFYNLRIEKGSHFSIDDGISDDLFKMMSETVGYDMSTISRDASIAHFNLYFKEKESKVRVFCEMHDNIFYLLYIDRNHETHKQTIEKRLEMDKLTEANRKAAMSLAKSLKR